VQEMEEPGLLAWWPSAVAVQAEAANHRELLRSRAVVVSVAEKSRLSAAGVHHLRRPVTRLERRGRVVRARSAVNHRRWEEPGERAEAEAVAPRPEEWPNLIRKIADGLKVDYDWTEEVGRITAQTLLVFADADSVRPAHIVEFYALLGGGLRDAHWDGSLRPANELAILPGLTHYDISTSPALAATVRGFLA
jgi:pimeloyl-ACP methyl ester carboxylesterase